MKQSTFFADAVFPETLKPFHFDFAAAMEEPFIKSLCQFVRAGANVKIVPKLGSRILIVRQNAFLEEQDKLNSEVKQQRRASIQ